MIRRSLLLAVLLALFVSSASPAAYLDAPVPTNAYITLNGYDWAWAGPLPGPDNGLDLSYQAQFGWHIPTAQELAFAPLATDFLFAGANVPYNGVDPISGAMFQATNSAYDDVESDGAVAVPYFNTNFHHADWQDGLGQTYGPWAGMDGAGSFADQLVVRAVPEPSTLALMVSGVGLVVTMRRRRARSQA